MPNRSSPGCPHEHTRCRNCHDARRPASSSKQQVSNSPDSKRLSRAFVVAVLGSWAKYYLPPASGSKVARYQGSRCPASVQCQVDCHCPTGTIPRPKQKRITIWTQGIIPEHTLITFGNLDVDIALELHYIVHRPAGVAGHFRQPAQQADASEASIYQQRRTDGVGQMPPQPYDISLFQPVLRRVQFVGGGGPWPS